MAGTITIRKLVSVLTINATEAVKGLKAYSVLWDATAAGVEKAATRMEKAAARAGAAMAGVAAGAAGMQTGGGVGGSGGRAGGSPRGRAAGGQSSPVVDGIVAQGARSRAMQSGLELGAKVVNDATTALGKHATASERARAKVADLTKQVANNREAMAGMRRAALESGDSEGLLAARIKGVAVETGIASQRLAAARRELRAIDGSLIDAVKSAKSFRGAIGAAAVAVGNLASAGVQRLATGVVGALGESAKAAMSFEKSLVDVAKVAKDADLKDGLLDPRIKEGIKDVSRELGVLPDDVAKLTAQITAAFSGETDIVALASDVTKIGVAWDITGQQAGEYFKQTSAGLQLEAAKTKQLFGLYNELSNQFGIQAKDIAEAMTRSAGLLKGANISGEIGAALNATLIKTGASADVAATGVKTFIKSIGAGATSHQIQAFKDLGLSMEDVRKNLASGDPKKAQAELLGVAKALDELGKKAPEKRLEAMVNLFGSESIGSIGAAATATDLLAQAFDIAGNKAAALTSVEKEYKRVSDTTAAGVDKLKAQVAVLAIEFGEALLPHIDKIVAFFQTPEGKEWGARAVEKAVVVVTTLADVLATVASGIGKVIDMFGGAETAVGVFGVAILALLGPIGVVTAALAAMLVLNDKVQGAADEMTEAIDAGYGPGGAHDQGGLSENIAAFRAAKAKGASDSRLAAEDEASLGAGGGLPFVSQAEIPDRVAPMGPALPRGAADGGGGSSPEARFAELAAKRNASRNPLDPSEAKELRHLSKALDRAIPARPGKGHKATKMDRQLAAMDPSLRGLLRQGGEEDSGGDLKVAGNALDRGVYERATKGGRGGLGVDGVGSTGPGPNITQNDNRQYNITVQQQIDASSHNPAAENIKRAGGEAAQAVGGVVFTGASKVIANRNSGARLVP